MHDIYRLASGNLVWAAFIIFIAGTLYQVVSMIRLARKKDPLVFHYFSFYYALRSILHWILPFASTSMRANPVLTIVAFIFHFCLIAAPIFLFAHIILLKEAWGIS